MKIMTYAKTSLSIKRHALAGLLLAGAIFPQACGCNDTPTDGNDGGSSAADAGSTANDAGMPADSGPAADSGPVADAGPVVDAGPMTDAGTVEDGGQQALDAGVVIPPVGGVGVTSASVRACDLLFLASQAEVPTITFNAAVRGRFVKDAPQVAASFVAAQDQSLEGVEILEFVYERAPGAVTLVKADCFDASGNAVVPAGVSINP